MSTAVLDTPTTAAVDRSGCDAIRHGGWVNYSKHRCRCDDARAAASAYRHNLYIRNANDPTRRREPPAPKPAPVIPDGMVSSRNTTAMLRVFVGLGYDWASLGQHLGCSPQLVAGLAHLEDGSAVPADTAGRIRGLGRLLLTHLTTTGGDHIPPPCGDQADTAMAIAVRNRWGVVDVEVVARALRGLRPPLTQYERRAVVYTAEALGWRQASIAAVANANTDYVRTALAA